MTAIQVGDFFGTDVDLGRMHQDRRDKLVASMHQNDVDALVLVDLLNVEYATGVAQRGAEQPSVALVTGDQAVHIFDAPPDATLPSPLMPQYLLDTWKGVAKEMADLLRDSGVQRVAIDCASLVNLRWLRQELGHPTKVLVDETGAGVVMAARVTKTSGEVECLRRSNRAMGYALDRVREALKPGSTVADLVEPVRQAFAELDPDGTLLTMGGVPASKTTRAGLMCIASASENFTAGGEPMFPFPPEPGRPFRAGDVVWPDAGLGYCGLESDYGRTWLVGDNGPNTEQRDQFKRWLEVRNRVVEVLRPGHKVGDAVGAAKSVGGKTPWLSHLFLAHGTGLFTEYPFFGIDPEGWLARSLVLPSQLKVLPQLDDVELRPGMVFVLEPVIWDEYGGYRAEDTYLLTDGEPELLSKWSYAPFD
jgi:Xaa-Pro aminopeptidase